MMGNKGGVLDYDGVTYDKRGLDIALKHDNVMCEPPLEYIRDMSN